MQGKKKRTGRKGSHPLSSIGRANATYFFVLGSWHWQGLLFQHFAPQSGQRNALISLGLLGALRSTVSAFISFSSFFFVACAWAGFVGPVFGVASRAAPRDTLFVLSCDVSMSEFDGLSVGHLYTSRSLYENPNCSRKILSGVLSLSCKPSSRSMLVMCSWKGLGCVTGRPLRAL